MPDHAVSSDPAVQAQLDRLTMLSPGRDVLGLARIRALCARLGDPQHHLPPVFHVAGTNGKGSTTAFLRAMLEAAGKRVHVYTSPHLVRFNERIRVGGTLIGDDALAPLLAEVLDGAEDIAPSFFEATTAAALLAFARTPADACIIEVGLGGRLDATNVIDAPLVCGIASLGIDHKEFLLAPEDGVPADPLVRIAFEKAGIAKPGAPLVTQDYAPAMNAAVAAQAARAGTAVRRGGRDWSVDGDADGGWRYRDAGGSIALPAPGLAGAHQVDNAALAVAMLRAQDAIDVDVAAMATGLRAARWPARMQRLGPRPLTALAGEDAVLWVDGGHNVDAAVRIADWLDTMDAPPTTLIAGLLANKDAAGFLAPLARLGCEFIAVPVPGHACHAPGDLAAMARAAGFARVGVAENVGAALAGLARPVRGAVLGSLYLAGEVLRANEEWPD